jgi:hypothetical protein
MSENWVITPDATSEYELTPADADVETWQHTVVTTSSTSAKPEVDVFSVSDDATAADNVELDYDGTGYAKTNSTIGTVDAATLANGVEHGGTTATLRLGASGATPAFYVTNSGGIAARVEATGSSAAMRIQGGGAAAGIRIDGGPTGTGVQLLGGSTSGDAVTMSATSGVSVNAPDGITADITGNVSGSVGSVTGAVGSVTGSVGSVVGHTAQTGDTYALANGAAGFVAIDTVVDAIKVKTDQMVYTKANELDVNTQSINGATVVGDGNATPWDGA